MKKNKKYFTLTMSCIMICTSVLAAFPLQAYATSGTISDGIRQFGRYIFRGQSQRYVVK